MGRYSVELTENAQADLRKIHKSGNTAVIKKMEILFIELSEHPYTGTGKPEPLKGIPQMWSRRLDKKDRIIYTVEEPIITVFIVSALGHYDDK